MQWSCSHGVVQEIRSTASLPRCIAAQIHRAQREVGKPRRGVPSISLSKSVKTPVRGHIFLHQFQNRDRARHARTARLTTFGERKLFHQYTKDQAALTTDGQFFAAPFAVR